MVKPKPDLVIFAVNRGIIIPPQTDIVAEATQNIRERYNLAPDQIKVNFDNLLYDTEREAYKVYLGYEVEYGQQVFKEYTQHLFDQDPLLIPSQFAELIAKQFNVFERFFLSLSQSRKQRAGATLEDIVRSLFRELEYPFTEQPKLDGRPDFVLPSESHYRLEPMECIVFTCKRTLRERWRQVATEATKGAGIYLATLDEKISPSELEEIKRHKIYLVCPKQIKENRYNQFRHVLSFEQFFTDYLDPAMERWKRNGILDG